MFVEGFVLQQTNSLEQTHKQRKGVYLGFSSLIFLYWMAMAPLGYNTLLLQGYGFTSGQVGSIMAAFAAVGIVAPPIWGYIADRIHSVSKTFLLVFAIQALVIASLPLFGGIKLAGFSLLAIAMPISNIVRNCSQNLLDAWTMQSIARVGKIAFGSVRFWGSLGWTVACVAMSFLASLTDISIVFYIAGILGLIVCVYGLGINRKYPADNVSDTMEKVAETTKKLNPFRLFKNYYFVVLLFYVLLGQMMFNTTTTFMPYLLESLGIDPNFAGTAIGLRSLTEVPFLVMGGLLLKRVNLPKMMAGIGLLLAIEQFSYTWVGSAGMVVAVVLIGGLASGLYFTTTIEYAFRLAPEELSASAQTFLGMATALGMIFSSLLGGWMVDAFGVTAFYATCGAIILTGCVLFILSFPFAKKVLKKPLPASVALQK